MELKALTGCILPVQVQTARIQISS